MISKTELNALEFIFIASICSISDTDSEKQDGESKYVWKHGSKAKSDSIFGFGRQS